MKRCVRHICMLMICMSMVQGLFAQQSKGLRGKGGRKEILKRQQEAQQKEAEATPFAPSQKSGTVAAEIRDDMMWPAESGNTVYPKAGNLSVVVPSRYGLTDNLELESYLGLCPWVPNLFVKNKWWSNGRWYLASRHGLYSGTPGYQYYQSKGDSLYARPDDQIPIVLSTKNQLILSRVFRDRMGCRGNQPWLILSGGVGLDVGFPFGDNDLGETNKHFLANRSMALTGTGYLAHLFVRGDYQISAAWVLAGSFKYFRGDFTGSNAFEQQFTAEGFISDNISISFGFALSEASYNTSSVIGVAPLVDVCWYFGTKKSRQMGLFNQNFKMVEYKTQKNKRLNRDNNRGVYGR